MLLYNIIIHYHKCKQKTTNPMAVSDVFSEMHYLNEIDH